MKCGIAKMAALRGSARSAGAGVEAVDEDMVAAAGDAVDDAAGADPVGEAAGHQLNQPVLPSGQVSRFSPAPSRPARRPAK